MVMLYRFLFNDLLTGAAVAEVRPTAAQWDESLNAGGAAQLTAPTRALAAALGYPVQNMLGKTCLTIVGGSTVLWSGLVWDATIDLQAGTVALTASNLLSILRRRIVRADLSYTGIDQAQIAKALVDHAQATTGTGIVGTRADRNLRTTTTVTNHGVTRTAAYLAADSMTIGEALDKLAQQTGGFDYKLTPSLDATMNLTHQLALTYPNTGTASGLTLIHRSNCRVKTLAASASAMTTDVMARGKDGIAVLRSSPLTSYPALEDNRSWTDETVLTNLQSVADRALKYGSVPSIRPSVSVLQTEIDLPTGYTFRLVVPEAAVDGTYRVVQRSTTLQGQTVLNDLSVVVAGVYA